MSNTNATSSSKRPRLNYTNVTVSNEKLNEPNSASRSLVPNRMQPTKPNGSTQNLTQIQPFKPTYEKSNIKGSNTNLNRIIKNKNLNSQSNTSLNTLTNQSYTSLNNKPLIPRTITTSNTSLNRIQKQNTMSQSTTSINSKTRTSSRIG